MSVTEIIMASIIGLIFVTLCIQICLLIFDITISAYKDIKSKICKITFIAISVVPSCVLPTVSFYYDRKILYSIIILFLSIVIGTIFEHFISQIDKKYKERKHHGREYARRRQGKEQLMKISDRVKKLKKWHDEFPYMHGIILCIAFFTVFVWIPMTIYFICNVFK